MTWILFFLTKKKVLMEVGNLLAMEVNGRFFEKEMVTLIQMPVKFQGYTWVKAAGTCGTFIICFEVLNESEGVCLHLQWFGASASWLAGVICAVKCLGWI